MVRLCRSPRPEGRRHDQYPRKSSSIHFSQETRLGPGGNGAIPQRLHALWSDARTPCYLCDAVRDRRGRLRDFCLVALNGSALDLIRQPRSAVLGRRLTEVFPSLLDGDGLAHVAEVLRSRRPSADDRQIRLPGGGERWFEKYVAPSDDGVAIFLRDLAPLRETVGLLLHSMHELEEAQRIGRFGSWHLEVKTGRMTWSKELFHLVGRDPGLPPPNYEEHRQFVTAESWERLYPLVAACVRDGTPYVVDLELVRPDGEIRHVQARGTAQRDARGEIMVIRGTTQDITERKLAEQELRALPGRILEAQEQERRRVARELHDGVGQQLVSISYRLHAAKAARSTAQRRLAAAVGDSVNRALAEVRRICHGLRPSMLDDLGLRDVLKELVANFRAESGIALKASVALGRRRLPPPIEEALYRIAQEALTNIEEHAGARRAELRVKRQGAAVHLHVRDDGRGFPAAKARRAVGIGLLHMRERAELLGGTFALTTARGQGTTLDVRIPLPPGKS